MNESVAGARTDGSGETSLVAARGATLLLNGRFLSQTASGVQRFAREIVGALNRIVADEPHPGLRDRIVIAVPPRSEEGTAFGNLTVRTVGRLQGHLWEQMTLPRCERGGVLVNLGNTGSILRRGRQFIVLHDAGVYDLKEAYSLKFRAWYQAQHRLLLLAGARFITVSAFSQQRIAAALGIDPASITVVSEGADHVLRVPPEPGILDRHGLRARPFVLCVGNLAPHKNLAALVPAARRLEQLGASLVVAGGPNLSIFKAGSMRLPTPAAYLGRVSDGELRALYESASAFVFPSSYEGFGLPPVEAMTCGCPTIVADAGALPEVCGDGALYCDPGDPEALAGQIEQLITDRSLAADLRSRGSARARKFTWDRAARQLLRVVYPAVGQGVGSASAG